MVRDAVSADELVEAAGFSVCRLVLVDEGQLLLLEFFEELVPRVFLE